jgi:hypothetical protein
MTYTTLVGMNRVIVTDRLLRCPLCGSRCGFEEIPYRGTMASGMEAPDLRVTCTDEECLLTSRRFPTEVWIKGTGHKSIRKDTEATLIKMWNTRFST